MHESNGQKSLKNLDDEALVATLQKLLKRKPVIELKEYFADPEIDVYFHEIYSRYKKRIEYYCLRFVHDADLLPDLFHDIFIKVYLNIHRYKSTKNFKAWVYKIAHNNCINYVRKNQNKELAILNRKVGSETPTEMVELIDSDEESILNAMIKGDMKEAIDDAIRLLPYEYINIYLLKAEAGLTFEESAKILKVSSRSLKTAYQNCLRFINKELKERNYHLGDAQDG